MIRHACCLGLANALTAGTLMVAMIEPTLVTGPMTSTRRSLRSGTRDEPAWRSAEPLAAIAGAADAEHELAQRTSLEAQLVVVHRISWCEDEKLAQGVGVEHRVLKAGVHRLRVSGGNPGPSIFFGVPLGRS
jgi:hypothetical protein